MLVAVEKRGQTSGRIRMAVIPDFKATTLGGFIKEHVTPGSTIYTDGLKRLFGSLAAGPERTGGLGAIYLALLVTRRYLASNPRCELLGEVPWPLLAG